MSKLLTLALASFALLSTATAASAESQLSGNAYGSGDWRRVDVSVGSFGPAGLDLTVTGGANGVITFSDPDGVSVSGSDTV